MSWDLAGWLLTQISEDETRARRAIARSKINEYGEVMNFDLWAEQDWIEIGTAQLEHVEAWHPIRVLAECAAKRAIIQRCVDLIASFGDWDAEAAKAAGGRVLWTDVNRRERADAHSFLDALAQPYSDRPGFRPEWQVTP